MTVRFLILFSLVSFLTHSKCANASSSTSPKIEIQRLFKIANTAFSRGQFQLAIDSAENIRKTFWHGNTKYLNEAKQIIDRAKIRQAEDFEPFLITAKDLFSQGGYSESQDLCLELQRRDPYYEPAKKCVRDAKRQLDRLRSEALHHRLKTFR